MNNVVLRLHGKSICLHSSFLLCCGFRSEIYPTRLIIHEQRIQIRPSIAYGAIWWQCNECYVYQVQRNKRNMTKFWYCVSWCWRVLRIWCRFSWIHWKWHELSHSNQTNSLKPYVSSKLNHLQDEINGQIFLLRIFLFSSRLSVEIVIYSV